MGNAWCEVVCDGKPRTVVKSAGRDKWMLDDDGKFALLPMSQSVFKDLSKAVQNIGSFQSAGIKHYEEVQIQRSTLVWSWQGDEPRAVSNMCLVGACLPAIALVSGENQLAESR